MLFTFAGQSAWADKGDKKYSYYVAYNKVKVNKTGAGLVYTQQGTKNFDTNFNSKKAEVFRNSSKSNDSNGAVCTEIVDKQSAQFTFYMQAEEKEGYKFVRWINEAGEEVSTQKYCSVKVITTNYCGEYTEAESKDSKVWNNPQENNPNYYDALYTAVFEPLVKDPLIKVRSNNTNLGMTTITHEDNSNAVENDIGDDVVLFAYTVNYDKKFLGWQKNGEIVSRENPWHMQVSEENAGEYTAVFDDGYKFCRMKNFGTEHRYITAVNDEGGLDDLTAIQLEDSFDDIIANAGSVIEIYTETTYVPIPDGEGTKKVTYHDFKVQNSSGVDKGYYDFSGGKYLRMPHYTKFFDEGTWAFSQADITYNEEGKKTGLRFRDKNGNASFASLTNDPYSQWYIEPMDKDLETCENYFSLDPAKLVEVGDKYYTTLRTSWNILFNPDQMTPYVVTSVDEEEGTFEMQPITGNIIPLNTPVIIETKSNDIEENRMVPTKTNEASGAVPSGNLLKVSTKYFPNQDAPVSNCRKLMKNADGELAFGGDALSKVNGNEAYLSVSSEVVLKPEYKEVTLAQLVSSGKVGSKYRIKDGDIAAIVTVDQNQLIICKDDNKYANPDEKQETWYDYIHMQSVQHDLPTSVPATYDQSNWIGLRLPNDQQIASTIVQQHQQLTDVRGVLTNKDNPELLLDGVPKANEMATQYSFNVYVAPNFYGENHQTGDNGAVYFFVQPKPMEPALVEWLIWDGNQFVTPPKASNGTNSWNQANLKGSFDVNFDYIESGEIRSIEQLIANYGYRMPSAIVRLNTPSPNGNQAPRRAGETTKYVVYPLVIEDNGSSINDGVITDVARVVGQREVTSTEYYNVAGIRSDRPWQGVNIVVMRYSDGTTSASKMLR